MLALLPQVPRPDQGLWQQLLVREVLQHVLGELVHCLSPFQLRSWYHQAQATTLPEEPNDEHLLAVERRPCRAHSW